MLKCLVIFCSLYFFFSSPFCFYLLLLYIWLLSQPLFNLYIVLVKLITNLLFLVIFKVFLLEDFVSAIYFCCLYGGSNTTSSSVARLRQSPMPVNCHPYPLSLARYEDVVATSKLFMDTLGKLHTNMGI